MNSGNRPPNKPRSNSPRSSSSRNNSSRSSSQNTRGSQRASYVSAEEIARREAYSRQRQAQAREAERRRQAKIAYEKRLREQEKAIRRQEFREDLKIIGFRLLVFLVVLFILTILAIGVFLLSFSRTPNEPASHGNITYFYGGQKIREAPVKDSTNGKIIYFCFNDLSDYLGMSESGTAQEMKFILPAHGILPENAAGDGSEESIVFLSDKTKVLINGQVIELDTPNILHGTEIWVSTKFATDYMVNLSLQYDENKRELLISRMKDEENSTEDVTRYLEPAFKLKSTAPIDSIKEDPLVGDVSYSTDPNSSDESLLISFKTDLADFEKYMDPKDEMRDAFLTLVNSENPLESTYSPSALSEISHTSIISETQYLTEYAAKALDALFAEMKAAEFYSMAVYKGYSADDLNDEHALGLSVDMDTLGCVSTDFQYQPEYDWLTENAWKFGFILRYPKNKTSETGHSFEPWHYRYVGRYHAQKIYASGLSLEEYLDGIK